MLMSMTPLAQIRNQAFDEKYEESKFEREERRKVAVEMRKLLEVEIQQGNDRIGHYNRNRQNYYGHYRNNTHLNQVSKVQVIS
jgi:hypothetical protein